MLNINNGKYYKNILKLKQTMFIYIDFKLFMPKKLQFYSFIKQKFTKPSLIRLNEKC